MNKLFFIAIVVLLNSCTLQKKTHITVIGKTGFNSEKGVGSIYSTELRKAYKVGEIEKWPDSLEAQYLKVSGWLKDNYPKDTTTNRQIGFTKYSIEDPVITIIKEDSLKDVIDSAHHKCSEIRRFVNRLQVDKVLDSLVVGDSVVFLVNQYYGGKIPGSRFISKGSKTIYFMGDFSIGELKNPEYFVFSEYPCINNSEYNIDVTHIKKVESSSIKSQYHLTGNSNRINMSKDFSIFWKQWRDKVLSHDFVWLELNTNFPLTVIGRLDTDTIYKISSSNFEVVFDLFLKTKYSTNLDYFKVTKESSIENHDGWPPNYRRMNDMIFCLTDNNWKLVEIYMDTESIDYFIP